MSAHANYKENTKAKNHKAFLGEPQVAELLHDQTKTFSRISYKFWI